MQGQAEQIIGYMEKNKRATLPIIVGKCDLIESRLECARIMHYLSDLKVIKKENDEYVFLKRLTDEIPDIGNKRRDIFKNKISINKPPIRLVQARAKKIDILKRIQITKILEDVTVVESKIDGKHCGLIRGSALGKVALYLFNTKKRLQIKEISVGMNESYSNIYASVKKLVSLNYIIETELSPRKHVFEFDYNFVYPFATKTDNDTIAIATKVTKHEVNNALAQESLDDVKRIAINALETELREHQQSSDRLRVRMSKLKEAIKSLNKIK